MHPYHTIRIPRSVPKPTRICPIYLLRPRTYSTSGSTSPQLAPRPLKGTSDKDSPPNTIYERRSRSDLKHKSLFGASKTPHTPSEIAALDTFHRQRRREQRDRDRDRDHGNTSLSRIFEPQLQRLRRSAKHEFSSTHQTVRQQALHRAKALESILSEQPHSENLPRYLQGLSAAKLGRAVWEAHAVFESLYQTLFHESDMSSSDKGGSAGGSYASAAGGGPGSGSSSGHLTKPPHENAPAQSNYTNIQYGSSPLRQGSQRSAQHNQHDQPNNYTSSSSPSNSSTSGAYTSATYQRAEDHKPHTANSEDEEHYILSLQLDPSLHRFLTDLRNTHFPKKINHLEAHVAMFRALPGSKLPEIEQTLAEVTVQTSPFRVFPTNAFRMSKGVGINLAVGRKDAQRVHSALAETWRPGKWLSSQDDVTNFKPHVTVMNKVEDGEVVQKALRDVEEKLMEFKRQDGDEIHEASGIALWLYKKGKWIFQRDYAFEAHVER